VCQALGEALARYGIPDQVLSDNGKVFTARFGTGPGPVMFDRICADNGIRHLLTAPYSPPLTGQSLDHLPVVTPAREQGLQVCVLLPAPGVSP
jgi:hypothetical protein